MSNQFTSYTDINSLDEFSIISGGTFTLEFTVYEEDTVNLLDLSGATILWVVSPYGQEDYNVIQKSGTVTGTGTFSVVLSPSDTEGLSGKYIHQPIITDFSGNIYRPAQGTILIIPQIQTV